MALVKADGSCRPKSRPRRAGAPATEVVVRGAKAYPASKFRARHGQDSPAAQAQRPSSVPPAVTATASVEGVEESPRCRSTSRATSSAGSATVSVSVARKIAVAHTRLGVVSRAGSNASESSWASRAERIAEEEGRRRRRPGEEEDQRLVRKKEGAGRGRA